MDIKTSFISYICNQITNIEVKMVLEIRLSNMFSFRDEVTLDLQAAKIQTKKARELEGNLFSVDGEQMLKSVALFGANASGKSNVIKAIRACVNMVGGCSGNTQGIASLVRGMDIDEVIRRLEGIDCGGRGTSCPDQLAKALRKAKAQ